MTGCDSAEVGPNTLLLYHPEEKRLWKVISDLWFHRTPVSGDDARSVIGWAMKKVMDVEGYRLRVDGEIFWWNDVWDQWAVTFVREQEEYLLAVANNEDKAALLLLSLCPTL